MTKRQVRRFHLRNFLQTRGKPPLVSEWWTEDETGNVLSYGLAYIDFSLHSRDNGRVLGYDNAHGFHERHYMGFTSEITFTTYRAQLDRFFAEVQQIRSRHE